MYLHVKKTGKESVDPVKDLRFGRISIFLIETAEYLPKKANYLETILGTLQNALFSITENNKYYP